MYSDVGKTNNHCVCYRVKGIVMSTGLTIIVLPTG